MDILPQSVSRLFRLNKTSNHTFFSKLLIGYMRALLLVITNQAAANIYAPQLVEDIIPGTEGSYPQKLIEYQSKLYFTAENASFNRELWVSDGTASGTELVKNIYPQGNFFGEINGSLYFQGWDTTYGSEMWRSDGTTASTNIVKDIYPGSSGAGAGRFTLSNGSIFFAARDESTGDELWKTNGLAAGTQQVKDIQPGSRGSGVNYLTDVNGTLFFRAQDSLAGNNGFELWKSDGTAAGTVLVKDIRPGLNGSFPKYLINFAGTLYFYASDGAENYGLWKSDGTSAGTVIVKPSIVVYSTPVIYNGVMYFSAHDAAHGHELWKSDGTAANTVMVKDIDPGTEGSLPGGFKIVNGILYFTVAATKAGRRYGNEHIWKTDGTAAGTVFVKDTNPLGNSNPRDFIEFDGMLYFTARNENNKHKIWKSDGTSAGTTTVEDITPNSTFDYPSSLTKVGNTLFLSAYDDIHEQELWKLVELITASASVDSNGALDITSASAFSGDTASFMVTPNNGNYETDSTVGGNCPAGTWNGSTYTTGNLVSDCNVSFTHSVADHTVTPSAGANGSITPTTAQIVSHNATTAFTVTANANYSASVAGSCGGALSDDTYTTEAITENCTVEASFTLNNVAPVITEGASIDISLDEDNQPTAFSLTLNATDLNNDTLTWRVSSAASKGIAMASDTGLFKTIAYAPNANVNGSDQFVVEVSDGVLQDTIMVNLSINPVDDAPKIINAPSFVNVNEDAPDTLLDLSNVFEDVDSATIVLDIQTNTDTSIVSTSIAGTDLTLSYLPNQFGSADLTLRATADGKTAAVIFRVMVASVNDAPVITSAANLEFTDGVAEVNQLTATDIENDPLTYSITGGDDQALFNLTSSGLLSFIAPPDIKAPADLDANNRYELNIEVTDNVDTAVQAITIQPSGCNFFIIPVPNGGVVSICL